MNTPGLRKRPSCTPGRHHTPCELPRRRRCCNGTPPPDRYRTGWCSARIPAKRTPHQTGPRGRSATSSHSPPPTYHPPHTSPERCPDTTPRPWHTSGQYTDRPHIPSPHRTPPPSGTPVRQACTRGTLSLHMSGCPVHTPSVRTLRQNMCTPAPRPDTQACHRKAPPLPPNQLRCTPQASPRRRCGRRRYTPDRGTRQRRRSDPHRTRTRQASSRPHRTGTPWSHQCNPRRSACSRPQHTPRHPPSPDTSPLRNPPRGTPSHPPGTSPHCCPRSASRPDRTRPAQCSRTDHPRTPHPPRNPDRRRTPATHTRRTQDCSSGHRRSPRPSCRTTRSDCARSRTAARPHSPGPQRTPRTRRSTYRTPAAHPRTGRPPSMPRGSLRPGRPGRRRSRLTPYTAETRGPAPRPRPAPHRHPRRPDPSRRQNRPSWPLRRRHTPQHPEPA